MNQRDDFSPSNLRRMRDRARTEVGYTREMQEELTALFRAMTPEQFDAYYDVVPYEPVKLEGETAEAWYASLVASYKNELAHYNAVKQYVATAK